MALSMALLRASAAATARRNSAVFSSRVSSGGGCWSAMAQRPVLRAGSRPPLGDVIVEACRRVSAERQDRQIARDGIPYALELEDRASVAARMQRHDHGAEVRQSGRARVTAEFVELLCDSRQQVRIRAPVPH